MRVGLVAALCGLGLLAGWSGGVVGEQQAGTAGAQAAANPAMKFDVVSFKR